MRKNHRHPAFCGRNLENSKIPSSFLLVLPPIDGYNAFNKGWGVIVLFAKEDQERVEEFINQLRSMNLSVESMVEDYDRLIALYDVSFLFRMYLRSCAQALHDKALSDGKGSVSANRYIQFFEGELTTMPRMIYLFQSTYGSRFVRSVYQASYLAFIERQQQATNFLKKCVAEHDKFSFFRKTIATIEENHLIKEPKTLNPRIKGQPHNRPASEAGPSAVNQEILAKSHFQHSLLEGLDYEDEVRKPINDLLEI